MKNCAKCGFDKALTEFNKNKNRPDGLSFWCKSCVKDYSKQRYETNKDQILSQHKKYREENKESYVKSHRQSNKKYHQKNKHVRIAATAKRRASKLNATPPWLSKEQLLEIKEFYRMAKDMEGMFPWRQQVDHIVPLQGETVCGLHVPWNLTITSEYLNKSKGNSFYDAFDTNKV